MAQTRLGSSIEALVNVGSGMILAYWIAQGFSFFEPQIQYYIWSEFEFHIGYKTNLITTPVFTVASIIRSFYWRRHFVKYWRG